MAVTFFNKQYLTDTEVSLPAQGETMQILEQENKLQAQSDAVIGLLTNRGILEDSQINDEKIREAKKAKRKNTYHNTMMLLQHYRAIVWVMECFPEDIADELEKPFERLDTVLGQMDLDMSSRHYYRLRQQVITI